MDWADRVVLWTVVLGACAAVERIDPLEPGARRTRVVGRDAPWFLVYLAVSPLVGRAGAAVVDLIGSGRAPLHRAPAIVQIAVGLVVFDLVSYGLHRAMHHSRLWVLHRVHHGSSELSFWTAFRAHPLSALLTHVVPLAAVALAGVHGDALGAVVFVVFVVTLLGHASVWSPASLEQVLATPTYHRRHHDPALADRNLALLFPVTDRIFGTAAFSGSTPTIPPRATPGSPRR
ncbi:MAG: sterol desaturase family protein [Acidimicrobiales bacterium]